MARFSENQQQSHGFASPQSAPRKPPIKTGWHRKVIFALRRFAGAIRDSIKILAEFVQLLLELLTYVFSAIVKLGVSPVAPIICAIALFVIVVVITINQWWQIGGWLAGLVGVPVALGYTVGLIFGIGINIFQLMPRLRKLSRAINRAYSRLKINTDYEPEEAESPEELERNWLSSGHRKTKLWSNISYCVESGVVVLFVFIAQNAAFLAILQAIVSLVLPEQTLGLTTAVISVMGAVSKEVAFEEPEDVEI